MKPQNEANFDRLVRVILGTGLVFCGILTAPTVGCIMGTVGLVLLITGLRGWCPLYALLKFDSNNMELK